MSSFLNVWSDLWTGSGRKCTLLTLMVYFSFRASCLILAKKQRSGQHKGTCSTCSSLATVWNVLSCSSLDPETYKKQMFTSRHSFPLTATTVYLLPICGRSNGQTSRFPHISQHFIHFLIADTKTELLHKTSWAKSSSWPASLLKFDGKSELTCFLALVVPSASPPQGPLWLRWPPPFKQRVRGSSLVSQGRHPDSSQCSGRSSLFLREELSIFLQCAADERDWRSSTTSPSFAEFWIPWPWQSCPNSGNYTYEWMYTSFCWNVGVHFLEWSCFFFLVWSPQSAVMLHIQWTARIMI